MAVLRAKRWALLDEWAALVWGYGEADWPAVRLLNRRIKNIDRQMKGMK